MYPQAQPEISPRDPLRVAMVAYAFYDDDNRIIRYAETLVDRGDRVDVFALARPGQQAEEMVRGVHVHRIQTRRRDEKGQSSHLGRMLRFLFTSARILWRHHRERPFAVIHVHSVPDFEIFAGAIPKRRGARLILDIHDIVPEFFLSKFGIPPTDPRFRALLAVERVSTAFADHVIIANHIWRDRLVARSVRAEKVSAMPNYVDTRLFSPQPRTRQDGRFVMLYPGGLQWHQGLDIAIRAFALARRDMPDTEFHIYGEGPERGRLQALAAELGLAERVRFFGPVPLHCIPAIMANADMGVVAKRANSFGNEAASTKIAEFMSQGVPVLVPRTRVDSYYYEEGAVRFFEPENEADMARHMAAVASDQALRSAMARRGREYVEHNGWDAHRGEYLEIVDRLAGRSAV